MSELKTKNQESSGTNTPRPRASNTMMVSLTDPFVETKHYWFVVGNIYKKQITQERYEKLRSNRLTAMFVDCETRYSGGNVTNFISKTFPITIERYDNSFCEVIVPGLSLKGNTIPPQPYTICVEYTNDPTVWMPNMVVGLTHHTLRLVFENCTVTSTEPFRFVCPDTNIQEKLNVPQD